MVRKVPFVLLLVLVFSISVFAVDVLPVADTGTTSDLSIPSGFVVRTVSGSNPGDSVTYYDPQTGTCQIYRDGIKIGEGVALNDTNRTCSSTEPQIYGYFIELQDEPASKLYISLKIEKGIDELAAQIAEIENSQQSLASDSSQPKVAADQLDTLKATKNQLDLEIAQEVKNYEAQLAGKHTLAKSAFSSTISPEKVRIKDEYYTVFNGFALDVSSEDSEKLKTVPGVKRVYPVYKRKANLMDAVPLINADDVWLLDNDTNNCLTTRKPCLTGKGIKIGIIDTGVDYTQPDLKGCFGNGCKVAGGWDFVNNDADPMDDNGHGTHVAATAAGNGTLKGVAPDALIYAFKALDSDGNGYDDDVLAAINRAMDPNQDSNYADHLDIISMSIGGPGNPNDVLSLAVDNAVDAGVVAVVAAGNEGPYFLSIGSPGTSRKAITVGATYKKSYTGFWWTCTPGAQTSCGTCSSSGKIFCNYWGDGNPTTDQITAFSSRGPVINGRATKPDIVAPGALICATRYDSIFPAGSDPYYTPCLDSQHVQFAGTSMATPIVSGAVALIKQAHPSWSPERIKYVLKAKAADIGQNQFAQGGGRINILNAINMLGTPLIAYVDNLAPTSSTYVNIVGSAYGDNFMSYFIQYAQISDLFQNGIVNPAWVYDPNSKLQQLSWSSASPFYTPVSSGILYNNFNLANFDEGSAVVIKLIVTDSMAKSTTDYFFFNPVDNLKLSNLSAPVFVRGAVASIPINGSVGGPAFQSYSVEWAPGWVPSWESDSSLAYTTTGVTLNNPTQAKTGTLATISTATLPPGVNTIRVTVTSSTGKTEKMRVTTTANPPEMPGWPVFYNNIVYPTQNTPLVGDIDADNDNEIADVTSKSELSVYNPSGTLQWSHTFPTWYGFCAFEPLQNLTLGSGQGDRALFSHSGSVLWQGGAGVETAPHTIADINHDGQSEIIFPGHGIVYVTKSIDGSILWTKNFGNVYTYPTLAVGELDGSPGLEIVGTDSGTMVTAWHHDGTQMWSRTFSGQSLGSSSPAIADIDLDGRNEIIVQLGQALYVLDNNGNTKWSYNYVDSGGFLNFLLFSMSPAIGNLDDDPQLEIVWGPIGLFPNLVVLNHDGSVVPGWPKLIPRSHSDICLMLDLYISSPVIGDVDGDNHPDIVLPASCSSYIIALKSDGTPIENDLFPLSSSGFLESGCYDQPPFDQYRNSVTLADVDKDGQVEVVATNGHKVDVWKLGTSYNPSTMYWPTFQHDPQHTGYIPPLPFCGDHSCNGNETCSSCQPDCGPCPPPPCPSGYCERGETCHSCPADCGPCPPLVCTPSTYCSGNRVATQKADCSVTYVNCGINPPNCCKNARCIKSYTECGPTNADSAPLSQVQGPPLDGQANFLLGAASLVLLAGIVFYSFIRTETDL